VSRALEGERLSGAPGGGDRDELSDGELTLFKDSEDELSDGPRDANDCDSVRF